MTSRYYAHYRLVHLLGYFCGFVLLIIGGVWTAQSFLASPEVSAASSDQVLVNSSGTGGTIYSKYYSLKDYWGMRGSAAWPQSSTCNSTGAYKLMPWLAENDGVPSEYVNGGTVTNGNSINVNGNCKNIFSDGGSNFQPESGGWLDPSSLSWTSIGGSAGFSSAVYDGPRSTVDCSSVSGNPRWIWGSGGADGSIQYYGPYNNSSNTHGFNLYSNGTTLFRQSFTIDSTTWAKIQSGTPVKFYAVADDWFQLYVNGQPLSPTTFSKQSLQSIPISELRLGTNTIAFQVSDKAVWKQSDNASGRQSGICYSLNIVGSGTVVGSADCPLDPSAATNATKHPLNLSTTGRSPSSTGTVSGYGDIPNARYGYGYEPSGDFTLNSVSDNYGQSTSFAGASQSSGPFTADYSTYINSYPYDSHKITAYYSVWYNRYDYWSSSTPTYYCNSGSVSGTSCVSTPKNSPTCDSPGSMKPAGCEILPSPAIGWQPYPLTDHWSCPSGGTYNGSTCYIGPALKHYAISKKASTLVKDYDSQTTSRAQDSIGQCYARQFTVSWSPEPTSGSLDSPEDPTSAQFSATIRIHFYGAVDTKPLRNVSQVTLSVNGSQIIQPSNVSPFGPCSGSDISVTSDSTSPSDSNAGSTITCRIQAPPLRPGDNVCADYVISPSMGDILGDGQNMTNTSGQLNASPCTDNEVTNQPYAHFFGNGVAAGGAFALSSGVCDAAAAVSSGDINANIEDRAPTALMRGSGTQYEAIANGSAASFLTANLRNQDPMSKFGLTFSNTNSGQIGTAHCIPDYMAGKPSTSASQQLDSGRQVIVDVYNGDQTINGGSQLYIANGISRTIYVTGNATINANIFYQTDGWKKIGVNSTNIPTFYLIASGDINISGNVSRLDGVYVSQGGTINTCYQQDFDSCDKQLTINGSFVGGDVQLYRTFSSLRNSTGGEWPDPTGPTPNDNPGSNCDLGDNAQWNAINNPSRPAKNYDCAAEVFNFNPATYLVRPSLEPVGGDSATHYDSIASLAPVL